MNDFDRVSALLAAAEWIFAKTMPQNPHEYTLRRDWDDDDFVFVVEYIRKHGYPGSFGGRTYIYLDAGDHFHWTMGAPINNADGTPCTILINRKPLTAQ